MMITPELDEMSPSEEQKETQFQQPKEIYLANRRGHLTVLSGDGSEEILEAQTKFMKAVAEGMIK